MLTVKALRGLLTPLADDTEVVLECEHSAYDAHAAHDLSRVRNGYLVLSPVAGGRGDRTLYESIQDVEEDGR